MPETTRSVLPVARQDRVKAVETSEEALKFNVGKQRRTRTAEIYKSEDHQDAVRAFVEKRKPVWKAQ